MKKTLAAAVVTTVAASFSAQALAKDVPDPKGGDKLVPNPYKTWREVNGSLPDTGIEVPGPPPTSGTRDAFSELAMEAGCDSIASIKSMKKTDQIQGSKINGIEPTFESISYGDYPVSRSLYFYVKKAHVGTIPGIEEYVTKFTSDKAWGEEGYLADKGLIPLPDDLRAEVAKSARAMEPVGKPE